MVRRVAFVLLMAATLAACDRFIEAARSAAAPIDDSGAYLVLELDTSAVIRDQLERASESMASALRDASPSIRYNGRGVLGDAARIQLVDPADLPRAREALRLLATTLVLTDDETGLIEARLTPAALDAGATSLVTESITVLQRRTAAHRLSIAPLGSDRMIARSAGPAFPAGARGAYDDRATHFPSGARTEPGGSCRRAHPARCDGGSALPWRRRSRRSRGHAAEHNWRARKKRAPSDRSIHRRLRPGV